MSSPTSKYRWPLNDDQLETLELLYKFRYGSSDLIAQYFNKPNGNFVYKRLKILQDQGFIGKRFDSSYRIKGKPAAYHVSPKGARKLQDQRQPEDRASINIKTIYRNKSASESFIAHCMDVFAIANALMATYGNKLNLFAKTDLAAYDYFPKPLPGVFVTLKSESSDKHFFLDLLDDSQPFFTHIRRVQQYVAYYDSDAWEVTEAEFPAVLLVCSSKSLQTKMIKYLSTHGDELFVYMTTFAVLNDTDNNGHVWIKADDPDELLSLADI